MVKKMYEIKIGKLMVEEVIATHKGKGGVFEFVNINDYNEKEFSTVGKQLIELPELFISFMDFLDPENTNRTIDNKLLVDYNEYEGEALITVFRIVDDLTSKKSHYYFDEDVLQYKNKNVETEIKHNNELSNSVSTKDIWYYITMSERYQHIVESMNSVKYQTAFIKKLDKALSETDINSINQIKYEVNDYVLGKSDSATYETDEKLYSILDNIIKDSFKEDFYYIEDTKMWIKVKDLSLKEIGKHAYEYMKNSYDYNGIEEKDMQFLKCNFDLVWKNIDDSDKDFLKLYLIDCSDFSEEDLLKASEKLQPVIDAIITEKLDYYYVCSNDSWEKLSKLGARIWNIALKYHNKFNDISELIEEDENFDSYMCLLGRKSISANKKISQDDINDLLYRYMYIQGIENCSDWSYAQWKQEVCTKSDIYKVMLNSAEEVIREKFKNSLEFNKDNQKYFFIGNKLPESEVEITYKSSIKVIDGYNDLDEVNRYIVECIIPYVDFDGKYKLATSLEYFYDENCDKFKLTNENIKSFVGVDYEVIQLEVDKLCREYGFDVPERIPF